jgi:uncharacterized protein (DUF1778 family)
MSQIKSKSINIRTTDSQYESIKELAEYRGTTISALLLDSVWNQIEDWEDIRDYAEEMQKDEPRTSWTEVQQQAGLA